MTYKDCLDYLFSQLPIYQRIGQAAYKADLNNTITILSRLKNPENQFKSIHIAGTNGKGSVSHMLASVLQEAGLKTGLYTSPHMKDFRERIKINGKEIEKQYVIQFVENNKELVQDIQPSFFEWTVALAFKYFEEQKVDIAVIETGMGGRLDSTNVLNPELSIITNIGLDHVQFLGDNLAKIASEKAGIIKENTPVVIGESLDETQPIFTAKAKSVNAPLVFAQKNIIPPFECALKGPYQNSNQQTVLNSLEVLKKKIPVLNEAAIKTGLAKVIKNTNLRGRWEWIGQKPRILLDMAHNEQGVNMIFSEINKMTFEHLHIVWGMVSDKDIGAILKILPKNASYYFCKPNIPRGLNAEELHKIALDFGLNGGIYSSVPQALKTAKENAMASDLIFVGGSTFVVAEALP